MEDKYALEVEKMIFNWYYNSEESAPDSIFNAIQNGLKNDMQVLVPIENSEEMMHMFGDPEKLKVGDNITFNKQVVLKFRHLIMNDQGQYFIPIFTSEAELEKGESTSSINQSLNALFANVDKWSDCLGYVVNPWHL